MMVTAATVVGLSPGKRLLSSTLHYSDLSDKFPFFNDVGIPQHQVSSITNAKKISSSSSSHNPGFHSKYRHNRSVKALREHVDTAPVCPSTIEPWFQNTSESVEDDTVCPQYSVEALLLLQKSMLEKQLALHFEHTVGNALTRDEVCVTNSVTSSGISARQRRVGNRRRSMPYTGSTSQPSTSQKLASIMNMDVIRKRVNGYVKGVVSDDILTHTEVVRLSKKIRTGLSVEEHKSRLQKRIGCEPSEEQLAISLKMSCAELRSIYLECSLAREKLTMSNVRLVMSIAQRYNNMGAEMADLVQGGLIGLLRGIEKFDSSKGFKISTYVYWWIRQGVSRALVECSRTLRLPAHLHERLSLIRNAKIRLEDKGIIPTIDKIAETLNISVKKIKNATEANNKVFSLDREVFPSLNGLPGETFHSYIGDTCLENIPWNRIDEWALKNEVTNLINTTLGERERDIIRLYYGLDNECLTWEDISKRIGLSRERVRQVGLVALEKLKNGARKKRMEAMLIKY
ncbi:unnamed protein product [Rhodiola kirilowii]